MVLFFVGVAAAQNRRADSLRALLKKDLPDTERVNVLNNLCHEYFRSDSAQARHFVNEAILLAERSGFKKGIAHTYTNRGSMALYAANYPLAKAYFNKAIEMAREIKNDQVLFAALSNLGAIDYNLGNYDQAVKTFQATLQLGTEKANPRLQGMAYNNLGLVYWNKGDLTKALDYSLKGLQIREKINDEQSLTASYNNIGLIYYDQGNYQKALAYHRRSFDLASKIQDDFSIAQAYNNLGITYERLRQPDSAIYFQQQALRIRKSIGDLEGISASYNNLGNLFRGKGDHKRSLQMLQEALKISKQRGDISSQAIDYVNIGDVMVQMKDFAGAKNYYDSALVMARKVGAKGPVKSAYRGLAELYFLEGDIKQLNEYWKKYDVLKDSILNEDNSKAIAEMSSRYEAEKKEQQIESLTQKNQIAGLEANRNRMIIYGIVAGLILLLLLMILIYNRYRVKQRANKELERKNAEIGQKNAQIQKAFEIIEEKNKDITDSINYAKRIQQSVLPSKTDMDSMFEEYFVLYKPRDIVSGDFYWAIQVKTSFGAGEERTAVILSVIDCTGHGVPGAFMSLIGKTLLSQTVKNPAINSPADVLNYLDRELPRVLNVPANANDAVRDGMDMAVCAFDLKNNVVYFAGANNPIYIISKGVLSEIKADKLAIGGLDAGAKPSFTDHKLELQKGDSIYLFSDGYADQFGGPRGKKFKYKQLQQILLAHAHLPMPQQKEVLEKRFAEWKGALSQIDDVCIIGVRL